MKFTNETLLQYFLRDLKNPDVTHGFRPKAKTPNHWKFAPIIKNIPIDIDVLGDGDIWLWSDIHFNHKNIIRYAHRPYPDVETMNNQLILNYLRVVKPKDIVIWGGDITFGHVNEINNIIKSLPGYHIHITGNHDMDRRGKLIQFAFDEQYPCMVVDVQDKQLLFTHHPLTIVPKNCINIHGHIHQHKAPSDNHINICVEHTNYTPINMKQLLTHWM